MDKEICECPECKNLVEHQCDHHSCRKFMCDKHVFYCRSHNCANTFCFEHIIECDKCHDQYCSYHDKYEHGCPEDEEQVSE